MNWLVGLTQIADKTRLVQAVVRTVLYLEPWGCFCVPGLPTILLLGCFEIVRRNRLHLTWAGPAIAFNGNANQSAVFGLECVSGINVDDSVGMDSIPITASRIISPLILGPVQLPLDIGINLRSPAGVVP